MHITEEGIRGLTKNLTWLLPPGALASMSMFHSADSLENHKIKKTVQQTQAKIHFSHLSSSTTGPQNQSLLANSDLIKSLIHLLLFLAPTYMSSTVTRRPFSAISQSPEVWGLPSDVGDKVKPQRLRSIWKPNLSTNMLICHKAIMKIEVIHQNSWTRESQEQWKHLKFRKSLRYWRYKTQGYRHININLFMLGAFSPNNFY